MAYLDSSIYNPQAILAGIPDGHDLHVCSAQPANFAGVAGVSLGNRPGVSLSAVGPRPGGGLQRSILANFNDGVVTAAQISEGTHWAYVDQAGSRLLAAGRLGGTAFARTLVPTKPWWIDDPIVIGIPEPVDGPEPAGA